MTLSSDDENKLAALERFTESDDPVFAAGFDLATVRLLRRRRVVFAWCEFWVGLIVFVIGDGAARGVISTGTIMSCFGASLVLCAATTAVENYTGTRQRRRLPPGAGSGNGGAGRRDG